MQSVRDKQSVKARNATRLSETHQTTIIYENRSTSNYECFIIVSQSNCTDIDQML